MACKRSVIARAKLLYQQRLLIPSFSHTHSDYYDHEELRSHEIPVFQQRFMAGGINFSTLHGSEKLLQGRILAISASCVSVFARNFSSGTTGDGAAEEIEIKTNVADVLGDKAVEVATQLSPVANEVAIAAADSFLSVAALQHLIGSVHSYTGFDWWASIVLTTILIRSLQLPLTINQLISTSQFTILRPRLEEVKEEMQNKEMSPDAVAEGQARMKALFKEYGVTPFTPLKGLLITGPIFCSFFFAVRNLAEKVPSFKEGGALWFTDLTTPDDMYIFPILTALTFWITVEYNAQEGLERNPTAGTVKNISRVFAALTIPLTATFPKAIFCYWIASNLFSLMYGLVIKKPAVKKLLGIPIIPVMITHSTDKKSPGLSLSEAVRKYAASQLKKSQSSPTEVSSEVPANPRSTNSSVLSQRIKSLEKEVKGRKKGKKR